MFGLQWDSTGFLVNGERAPLISGEFHYFRVPEKDWRFRLLKLKTAGANAVATYVPWIVHEPQEGVYRFDDAPGRNISAFLSLCADLGLLVLYRPGPHVYSELVNNGLPGWLFEKYPEVTARRKDGTAISGTVSYLHPVFLEKARAYIHEVNKRAAPFLCTNGGVVAAAQIDNELGGIHIWRGSLDYSPEAMGFGSSDGYYPRFLTARYGTAEKLGETYGLRYESFANTDPRVDFSDISERCAFRRERDYYDFYCGTLRVYAKKVASWFREDGIDVALCGNSSSVTETPMLVDMAAGQEKPFLLGVDHYYTLGPEWSLCNNPSPQRLISWIVSFDFLRELDMPPSALELQAGNLADFPPMLREDLLALYMANTAAGLKGANYYIFTGGLNVSGTGSAGEIYDYNAMISAENEVRPTWHALKEHAEFMRSHTWLQQVDRVCDVQLGFTWESHGGPQYGGEGNALVRYLQNGVHFSLMGAGFLPRYRELGNRLDFSVPLIVASAETMPAKKQQAVIDFINAGGKAIITPLLPVLDETLNPCTLLKDFIGIGDIVPAEDTRKALCPDGTGVYLLDKQFTCGKAIGKILLRSERKSLPLALHMKKGGGEVIWLGVSFGYRVKSQIELFEFLLGQFGQRPTVECGNPTIWCTLFEDKTHATLFAMNLFSGAQEASLRVNVKGKAVDLGTVQFPAMTVRTFEL
ncbi:MAG: beta-galactosidase [Oscillospiraceae bacterium]|nr:beta-galactosidase [Oscillospiraceae bacterium]